MKQFYVVIHVETLQQTLINADYAYTNGADGIFLINHAISTDYLLDIYQEVRKKYPDNWIGLNFLGLKAEDAMLVTPADADGLWVDNAEIDELGNNIAPWEWYVHFKKTHAKCTYFGGVAFKYQRHVEELEAAAEKAQGCMDVICTSGNETGTAADLKKIKRLSSEKGKKLLALASGATPENVNDFLPYVDCFLVATGISRSFRMLDPARVKLFAGKIKEYNEAHLPDNVKFLEEMLLGGYYDWFEPCNWYTLLTAKPEYGDRCDWSKFDGFDWWCIVDNVPQFADKCPWNMLNESEWYYLLKNHPEFAEKCDWHKLSGNRLCYLLQKYPQFARYCSWEKLNKPDYWWALLMVQPQFAEYCPWEKFSESFNWGCLLGAQPQFIEKWSFDKFCSTDWANFLAGQPQFADKCPWDTFSGKDWAILLAEQPQFADICDWKKFKKADCNYLICHQGGFADHCNWNIFDGSDLAEILSVHPQFADKCNWDRLNHQDWCSLLMVQPQFADKCNCWNTFDHFEWEQLLTEYPQFVEKCISENLSGNCWSNILLKQPQLAEYCPWQKLDDDDWGLLYTNQPQFIDIYNAIYDNEEKNIVEK